MGSGTLREGASMARMHARKKGRSGSSRPLHVKTPESITLGPDEVKYLVVELSQEGMTTSQIGIQLRDVHGVPSVKVVTGTKVTAILTEAGITHKLPEDMENLIKKVNKLNAHLKSNRATAEFAERMGTKRRPQPTSWRAPARPGSSSCHQARPPP